MLLMPRLRLETLPKPSFHMNDAEVAFNSKVDPMSKTV